jgi:hypothetical protein
MIDLYYWTTPNGHKITEESKRILFGQTATAVAR